MKASVCTRYGPPDVVQLKEVGKPTPKDDEVLIKVYAATVTSGEVNLRSFTLPLWFWLPGRIMFGILKPRKKITGSQLAGEVEAVGKDVSAFKEGDQVFGSTLSLGFGSTCAEYKCLPEDGALVRKPANITHEQAAAIPFGGLTALHFLRKGNIQSGQEVLVYGASGSVGTYAVQLAKHFGAEVTGVCSTRNLELVESLGADRVIDYTQEDFTQSGEKYDVIFDAVDKSPFSRSKGSLKRKGVYITVGYGPILILQILWAKITGSHSIVAGVAGVKTEDLRFYAELCESGEVKPVIDRTYPLEQIAEAHRYVEKGHKRGDVVVTIEHSDS